MILTHNHVAVLIWVWIETNPKENIKTQQTHHVKPLHLDPHTISLSEFIRLDSCVLHQFKEPHRWGVPQTEPTIQEKSQSSWWLKMGFPWRFRDVQCLSSNACMKSFFHCLLALKKHVQIAICHVDSSWQSPGKFEAASWSLPSAPKLKILNTWTCLTRLLTVVHPT